MVFLCSKGGDFHDSNPLSTRRHRCYHCSNGKNQYGNDWNHITHEAGLNCWIGKLADGTVTVNGVKIPTILCHADSYSLGFDSGHSDVNHWFPKFGKSMATARADVKALLGSTTVTTTTTTTSSIKAGDLVKITGSKYYNGTAIPSWVKAKNWYVYSVSDDRAVINKSEDGKNAIMSPIKVSDISLVTATSTTATATQTYRIHAVVKGDTLWDIAVKYLGKGARYTEIKMLNGLTSNIIHAGQKLKIPS